MKEIFDDPPLLPFGRPVAQIHLFCQTHKIMCFVSADPRRRQQKFSFFRSLGESMQGKIDSRWLARSKQRKRAAAAKHRANSWCRKPRARVLHQRRERRSSTATAPAPSLCARFAAIRSPWNCFCESCLSSDLSARLRQISEPI